MSSSLPWTTKSEATKLILALTGKHSPLTNADQLPLATRSSSTRGIAVLAPLHRLVAVKV